METSALIDWMSITAKGGKISPSDIPQRGELASKGLLGYSVRENMPDGRIVLNNPSRPDMGTHVIYSGATLKKLIDEYIVSDLGMVLFHHQQGHTFTRIDIAVDIMGGFTANEAIKRFENKEGVTLLRRADKVQGISNEGATLYVGRRGGSRMVRLYNKAAESNFNGIWTRVEAEIRMASAAALVRELATATSPRRTIHAAITGILDFPKWPAWRDAMGGDFLS